jgi:Na+/melibiose symporter-like transporter
VLFAAGPAVLNAIAIVTLQTYPIDAKRQAEITAALAARGGAPLSAPQTP